MFRWAASLAVNIPRADPARVLNGRPPVIPVGATRTETARAFILRPVPWVMVAMLGN